MQPEDRAANLEFWSGRGRGGDAPDDPPVRPRPTFRSPRGRRTRPVAAAVLLAGLAAAWLIAGQHAHGPSPLVAVDQGATAGTAPVSSAPANTMPRTSTTVPVSADCRGLSPARSVVRCMIDAIDVDVRLYSSATVAAAYRRSAGAKVGVARSGAAACAHGVPDERAWSLAAAPAYAVGRYRCRFERGRAAMWWTHGDRLLHAVAPDGDLAALFTWWRLHPAE